MHQVLHHAMHHAMQAHLLFELFCRGDPLEQLRFGDEHGVELLARVLLVAPTALPLRRAFAQKLEHEELAVLRGREEVGLIMDGFTMGRGHRMDEVGKLRRSTSSFR